VWAEGIVVDVDCGCRSEFKQW